MNWGVFLWAGMRALVWVLALYGLVLLVMGISKSSPSAAKPLRWMLVAAVVVAVVTGLLAGTGLRVGWGG